MTQTLLINPSCIETHYSLRTNFSYDKFKRLLIEDYREVDKKPTSETTFNF